MHRVLVCSIAGTVVRTGRTVAEMRCALELLEGERAVAALVECAGRAARQRAFFLGLQTGVIRATLATPMRHLAPFADTLLFVKACAFEHNKACRAMEANVME